MIIGQDSVGVIPHKTPPPEVYTKEYFLTELEKDFLDGGIAFRHQKALNYLKSKPNEIILDIGCGRGEIVRECSKIGANCVGIDYSLDAIKLSRDFVKNYGIIIRASATNLPFLNEVFDKIVLLDVVEHLDKNDLAECLKEVNRCLKRKGCLLIHTSPNSWSTFIHLLMVAYRRTLQAAKLLKPEEEEENTKSAYYTRITHINEQNPISLKKNLSRNGFDAKVWTDFSDSTDNLAYWKVIVLKILFLFRRSIWGIAIRRYKK